MKTKLLQTVALAAMMLVPTGAVAQTTPNFGSEEVVSEETTWVFNDYETGDKTKFSQTDKLYLRAQTENKFTITATETQTLSFSDGYTVVVDKYALASSVVDFNDGLTTANSTISGKLGKNVPMFAINTNETGKLYVLLRESGTHNKDYRARFYFWNGETASNPTNINPSTEGEIFEAAYDVTAAGSVFIGSTINPSEIYAIRFVPTATKADKIVYIGATGYATFAATDNTNYSTPAGLSAYGAKAATSGNAVELISATNMKKQNGYILMGTPNTNYKLTKLDSNPSTPSGNELKRNNGDKTFSVDGDGKDSENKYNYILAADEGVAKFFAVSNESTLKNGKAWLQTTKQLTPAAGARGLSIIFSEGETTGINTVKDSRGMVNDYYNLAGQRVAQPTKGMYIVNGKKVIIK